MLLYHGTSSRHLADIRENGLRPRMKKRGNWSGTVTSNPRCVYLTDSYAPHFAFHATHGKDECVVLEVDTDKLHQFLLVPDEDCLEQAGRGHDNIEGDIKKRTMYYRRRILRYAENTWRLSIDHLGTCGYHSVIPPDAITRIVQWPHKGNIHLMLVWDCTISIMNQRIMGERYKRLTEKLMDGDFADAEAIEQFQKHAIENVQDWFTQDPLLPAIEGWRRML